MIKQISVAPTAEQVEMAMKGNKVDLGENIVISVVDNILSVEGINGTMPSVGQVGAVSQVFFAGRHQNVFARKGSVWSANLLSN